MILLVILLFFCVIFLLVSILFSDEVKASKERDPAAKSTLEILLLYPGLHAIIFYRVSHWLWNRQIPVAPRLLSQLARGLTGVEIHPGARIGKGLFIDHGMGVVIGETTVIGNNVTLYQGVTLGGTGKETGKRHPTLGDDIVIGAGAKVLGNIEIGSNAYIGANAVVIKDVPPNTTIVGVPGRITKQDGKKIDRSLDHIHTLDPVMQQVNELEKRLESLEKNRPSAGPKKNSEN